LLARIKDYNNLHVIGVMSHLACADEPAHELNKVQSGNFNMAVELIRSHGHNPRYIHLEATA